MEVTFLGTGTSNGVPVIGCHCPVCRSKDKHDQRFRTSAYVKIGETTLNIDAGPDFRLQMLNNHIEKLDAVLITHPHKDHLAGLDDVKPFSWINHKPFPVYGNKNSIDTIRSEFAYAFEKFRYPGTPQFELHEIDNMPFMIENVMVTPIPVMHYRLPILGFRIENMAYITDGKTIQESSFELLKNLKVLIINALRKEPHISHFSLSEALEVIRKVAPEKAYIIHISHDMGKHQEVSEILPDRVHLAYDGLMIDL